MEPVLMVAVPYATKAGHHQYHAATRQRRARVQEGRIFCTKYPGYHSMEG